MNLNAVYDLSTKHTDLATRIEPCPAASVSQVIMRGQNFQCSWNSFLCVLIVQKESSCMRACWKTYFRKFHLHTYKYRSEILNYLMEMLFVKTVTHIYDCVAYFLTEIT